MTSTERDFINRVEMNRGEIKNKDKYYPILCDIYTYSITEWEEELTERKNFGIGFVYDVVAKLGSTEQRDLFLEIYNGDKVNITNAKMKLSKYL